MASASTDKKLRSEKKSRDIVTDSQPADSDITMTDSTLVETQPDLPDEWEETQPLEEANLEVCTDPIDSHRPNLTTCKETQPTTP